MKLTIKQAPALDREKLRVRINEIDKPDNVKWYDYVSVKLKKNNKAIVCKLHGDKIKEIKPEGRKASLIRINEPLRNKLEVNDNVVEDFEIKKVINWFAWLYFIRYHPNDVVRVSTWLAIIAIIIAIVLGVLSIVLTFYR